MKETIIFSNRINQIEFLRSLARLNKPSFNVRIYNSFSLASEALEKSNYVLNKELIQKSEEVFKYIEIIEKLNDNHFKSYKDIYHLTTTIRNIRLLIANDNELEELKNKLSSELKEENVSLIIKLLESYLSNDSFIDFVSYLRVAAKHAKNTFKEIIVFKEEHISPLEKLLINELSNNNVKEISLLNYLSINKKDPIYKDINPYYGVDNEVEEVISRIYKNKMNLDEVNIVLASQSDYVNSLFRLMVDRNIPMTFTSGIPITLFNSYKLYIALLTLERVDKFDVNGYRKLFRNEVFNVSNFKYKDKLIEVLGRMKISFSKKDNYFKLNKLLECKNRDVLLKELFNIEIKDKVNHIDLFIKELTSFIDDISNGISSILNKYLIKNNELEDIALEHINDVILKSESIKDISIRNSYLDTVANINICSSISKEGAINVTSLNKGFSSIRKYSFILGMSANNFPGKPVENYLINDEELLKINNDAITSERTIELNNKSFDDYVSLNSSLSNDIYLSYSFYNLIETNGINPSSKIFEIVSKTKNENYLNDLKEKTKYFSSDINPIKKIGEAYLKNDNLNISPANLVFNKKADKSLLLKKYSPSSIDVFFECEVEFYVKRILGIQFENEYNRYQVIDNNHFGSLLHYLMQKYHSVDEVTFIKEANQLFSDYLLLNIPLVNTKNELDEFIKCALNGYNYLKQFTELIFEQPIESSYSKLSLGGRYDCLAKKDGEYVLIDFKSDRSIKRNSFDPGSIRQVLLYLKMLNNNGVSVNRGEYFYFRYNKVINANFTKDNETALESDLNTFEMALETNTFKNLNEPMACTYCPIKDFCSMNKGRK